MIRFDLERELGCTVEQAWPLVAEPALMNLWSTARIEAIDPGDGGHPGGTGAIRRVHVPGTPRAVLTEVIERSAFPSRLHYRVIAGAPIRHHQGVITLDPTPRGCHLRWQVEIDFLVPGLGLVVERSLKRGLDTSLDRLVKIASAPLVFAPMPPPPTRDLDESIEALASLRDGVDAITASQRAIADRLLGDDDDRGHFTRVYEYVTEGITIAADDDRFDHPGWILRLVPVFHGMFATNLARRLGKSPGEVEPHWARAFAITEGARARRKSRFEAAMLAVFAGMRAHIEGDLPRTLATVYRHYAGRCDYVRFRPDYLRMAQVFTAAGDRFMASWPRRTWTPRARFFDAVTPDALRHQLIDRTFYPITRERRKAFERGQALARQPAPG
ncbi:MAG: SRPBCC family protein [Deltaproteobacteria bacterium]|nr:SRPBCC family protein [Deltaproteobacteria bacterium]